MKKIISNLIIIIFLFFILLTVILTTIGIETNKFNNFVSEKASQTKKNINLELNSIKFKLDLKELSLFLETKNPKIKYQDIIIPIKNIKVYVDFLSLLKSSPKINKTNIILEELDINQLNKLSIIFKPSNLKSLINNKIKKGKLIAEIEIFLNEEGLLKNFIAKGKIKNLKAELFSDLNLTKTNLNFFADKTDVLIQNIFGNVANINISDGDIKLNFENGIKLDSNFNSRINLDKKFMSKYSKFLNKFIIAEKIKILKADLNNNISIHLDKTYKVIDYKYNISGNLEKAKFELPKSINSSFITKEINNIYLSDFQVKTAFSPNNIKSKGNGKYSFNNSDFAKIDLVNNMTNDLLSLKLDINYKNDLKLDLINYQKSENSLSNIYLDLEKKNDNIKINKFSFNETNNLIQIKDLRFKKDNILSFKEISVKTNKNGLINNDFSILNDKKISIKGAQFDASNLLKLINNQSDVNKFSLINRGIEIDFKNIKVPLSENLQNFKLIGEIKKGKFVKISSKGGFGGGNFLDISMKKDKDSGKKYLEVYSDLTRPLLTEYSFFNGLSGGKLLFTSIINESKSNSKLKIENFKIVSAPGVVKLLSLADLGGLVDLAEGEGLSFDVLEIDMEKDRDILKLNEILALGPSLSVLMEGYQDKSGLTSLRGTLVPAKTLNKIISKIPFIGNIVIPKEVGEGLFGISFKMKGQKGKIKTSINPIRTLTPRFIQKIIDRNKSFK